MNPRYGITRLAPTPFARRATGAFTGAVSQVRPNSAEVVFDARVLLLEHHQVNPLMARIMPERLGCTVSVANNGCEALDALTAQGFDVVLVCQMPEGPHLSEIQVEYQRVCDPLQAQAAVLA